MAHSTILDFVFYICTCIFGTILHSAAVLTEPNNSPIVSNHQNSAFKCDLGVRMHNHIVNHGKTISLVALFND